MTLEDTFHSMINQVKALFGRDTQLGWALTIGALALVEGTLRAGSSARAILALSVFSALLGAVVYIADDRHWLTFGVAVFAAAVQLVGGVPFLLAELVVALVFYRLARQDRSEATAWIGLFLTLPATFVCMTIMKSPAAYVDYGLYRPNVYAAILVLGVFGGAWFYGYSTRLKGVAEEATSAQEIAEVDRDIAQELARLKESQAALARDVHDVVGHSLAVILAQAESAEYLPEGDTEALLSAIDAIKGTARSALGEVRGVLSATQADEEALPTGDARDLIESTRASGHEVVLEETGEPVGLTPDETAVAYRVLQELLTNAIKHGTRDEAVRVVRAWQPGELTIEVTNRYEPTDPAEYRDGHGLQGIRQRLTRTGGQLEVVRRNEVDGDRFVARAHITLAEAEGAPRD